MYLKLSSLSVLLSTVVVCTGDEKSPLILTPLIQSNRIETARKAAKVSFSEFKDVESYSGFLTVNKNFNSNLFFWFFPSRNDYANDPVILWLQGGPGTASLFGLFMENGPFIVTANHGLMLRETTWIQKHSVLYIDNPVGAGFSFTDEHGYARNQTVIAESLYNALLQFFQLFPKLQKNNFFMAGESFAGKYIPSLAQHIHKKNSEAVQKINLRGMAIASGVSDPERILRFSDFLYQHGLVDLKQKSIVETNENKYIKLIQEEKWTEAAYQLFKFFNPTSIDSFQALTGFQHLYNILEVNNDYIKKGEVLLEYLKRKDVRAAIHVGDIGYHDDSTEAYMNLLDDIMRSVAPVVAEVTNHYNILVYTGQLDIMASYPRVAVYLANLNSPSGNAYLDAARHLWYVNEELAGYVKKAGNITDVLVRNAGHQVTGDQPVWVTELITKFTRFQQIH